MYLDNLGNRLSEIGADATIYPGSNWTIPLFGCATANKAVIKTVDFSCNGSTGFKDLRILDIHDKTFGQDEGLPIWAVEHRQDLTIKTVKPRWGLVSPEYVDGPGIQTIQREFLWLPESTDDASFGMINDNIAGSQFHSQARTARFRDWAEYGILP